MAQRLLSWTRVGPTIVRGSHPVVCQHPLTYDVRRGDVREQGDNHHSIQPEVQRCDVVPFLRGRFDLSCRQIRVVLQDLPDHFQQAIAHDRLREGASCLGRPNEACQPQQAGVASVVHASQSPLGVLLTCGIDLVRIGSGIARCIQPGHGFFEGIDRRQGIGKLPCIGLRVPNTVARAHERRREAYTVTFAPECCTNLWFPAGWQELHQHQVVVVELQSADRRGRVELLLGHGDASGHSNDVDQPSSR